MAVATGADVRTVALAIAAETNLDVEDVAPDTKLRDLGIESVLSVAVVERLEATYGPLGKALLFEFATVGELAAHLGSRPAEAAAPTGHDDAGATVPASAEADAVPAAGGAGASAVTPPSTADAAREPGIVPPVFAAVAPGSTSSQPSPRTESAAPRDDRPVPEGDEAIAIIGMAGQFPRAADIEAFWEGLVEGRDSIEVIPERLWDWREFWDERAGVAGSSYSKWGGFLPDHRLFDPAFFRISRLEAQSIDPQERVFLETVYHALEHAQYPTAKRRDLRVGLFVAVMWGSYQHYGSMTADAGASYATIANRASFALDLTGPSIPIDTMCSGSLTTLHMAAQSIRDGECEMAVAGGVNLTTHPNKYFVLSRTGFAARDGRCKPFAAEGDGYVPSEGSGALVLKRLGSARRDGDRVLAVVRHSAVNHGGLVNNLTMPNVDAQASLIDSTFTATGISPDGVDYVEAHAPGTALGDPIEVRALTETFARHGVRRTDIPIGSVKSNVGHLESAAGVASVVKVIEQMRHRRLVPSIHAENVNPNIDFDAGPLTLQVGLAPWVPRVDESEHEQPYRAMIDCFGAGGTNAHVLLEAGAMRAPAPEPGPQESELFLFSARTDSALEALLRRYRELVESFVTRAEADQARDVAQAVTAALAAAADLAPRHVRPGDLLSDLLPCEERLAALPAELARATGVHLPRAGFDEDATVARLIESVQYVVVPGCLPRTSAAARAWFQSLARATQSGRDMMACRTAVVASDVKDLAATLDALLADGREELDGCFRGRATPSDVATLRRELNDDYVTRLLSTRRLDRLGEYWAQGLDVDWAAHFPPAPLHVDLPLYPFDHEVCWAPRERPTRPRADERPVSAAPEVDLERSLATGRVQLPLGTEPPRDRSAQVSIVARMLALAVPDAGTAFVARIEPWRDLRTAHADGTPPDAVAVEDAPTRGRIVRCLAGGTTLARIHVGPSLAPGSLVSSPAHAGAAARLSLAREDDLDGVLAAVLECVATGGEETAEPLLTGHVIRHGALPRSGSILVSGRTPVEAEALVVDDRGAPVLTCTRVLRAPAGEAAPTRAGSPLRRFETSWAPYEPPAVEARVPTRVLILAPNPEVADRIAAAPGFAAAASQQVLLRPRGDSRLRWDGRWEIRLGDLVGLGACLRLVDEPDAVVFASAGDAATAREEVTALHLLAQETVRRNLFRRGGLALTVVTRGAVDLPGETPTPSGLAGYVRTLTREVTHPIAHLDVEPGDDLSAEQAALVARVAGWPDHARPHALRGAAVWRETVAETAPGGPAVPQFRHGGHYVLFGGSGTLGRRIGVEIARRYAARMTWVSRGPLAADAQDAVRTIREHGGDVHHVQADVADARAVRRACAEARAAFGPIHGVAHMTMTRNIRRIADLDAAELADLLADKVTGTEAVVAAARDEAAEFTLLFSSIDVHVGSVGWSAYTAGCAYQIAAAARGQAQGEPVHAIAWGFWEGIDDALATTLGEKGIGLITAAEGVEAMQSVLSAPGTRPVLAVVADTALETMGFVPAPAGTLPSRAPADGPVRVEPAAPAVIPSPREPDSTPDAVPTPAPVAPEPVTPEPVAAESPTPQPASGDVLGGLTVLFAEILKTDADALEPDADLLNYGVDSLIVVNIQAAMEERLGPVPTALLLDNPTLRRIAEVVERDHREVAQALRRGAGDAAGRTKPEPEPEPEPISEPERVAPDPAAVAEPGTQATSAPPVPVRVLRRVAPDGIDAFLRAYPSLYEQGELDPAPAGTPSPVERAGALTHGTVCLEGGEVEYFAVGEGEPVLLFSAVALTAPVWTHVLTSNLTAGHRLIVIHQPGYGLSKAITGCGNREAAHVTLEAVRALGEPGPYHVLASCLGSIPAMHLAADFPELTASLALVGAFHDSSDLEGGDPSTMSSADYQKLAEAGVATLRQDFGAVAEAEAARGGAEAAAYIEQCRELLFSSQKVNFLAALRYLNEMMSGSMAPVLQRIRARSWCVYGEADQIISTRQSVEIASMLSSAELSRIESSGHFPYLTHPGDFIPRYRAFLAGDAAEGALQAVGTEGAS